MLIISTLQALPSNGIYIRPTCTSVQSFLMSREVPSKIVCAFMEDCQGGGGRGQEGMFPIPLSIHASNEFHLFYNLK